MKTKRILMIAALLFATSVINFSCKSDDDGGGGGSAAPGKITAKIDGSNFESIEMTTTATLTNGVLMVMGNDGGQNPNRAIQLQIMGFDGEGTYPVGGDGNIFNLANYIETNVSNPTDPRTWSAPYDENLAGQIKVSEINDDFVKGTFHFEAKNPNDGSMRNITEGSFTIELTNIP